MKTTTLSALALTGLFALAANACGGITNPENAGDDQIATITGRLTTASGDVPAGMRVAVVWRIVSSDSRRLIVGGDAPVSGDAFSITVAPPPLSTFVTIPDGTVNPDGTFKTSPAPLPPEPGPRTASFGLRTLNEVGGSIVTDDLSIATGAFVLYRDLNGNGAFDVSDTDDLATPDEILGGNPDLVLSFLQGGGQLAYERLLDKAGNTPARGLNIGWLSEERWLPLTSVELALSSDTPLPDPLCRLGVVEATGNEAPICSEDGRSYWYDEGTCSRAVETEVPSLCPGVVALPCSDGPVAVLPPGEEMPDGWPCNLTGGGRTTPDGDL